MNFEKVHLLWRRVGGARKRTAQRAISQKGFPFAHLRKESLCFFQKLGLKHIQHFKVNSLEDVCRFCAGRNTQQFFHRRTGTMGAAGAATVPGCGFPDTRRLEKGKVSAGLHPQATPALNPGTPDEANSGGGLTVS